MLKSQHLVAVSSLLLEFEFVGRLLLWFLIFLLRNILRWIIVYDWEDDEEDH